MVWQPPQPFCGDQQSRAAGAPWRRRTRRWQGAAPAALARWCGAGLHPGLLVEPLLKLARATACDAEQHAAVARAAQLGAHAAVLAWLALAVKVMRLTRPGFASILPYRSGTQKLWITSSRGHVEDERRPIGMCSSLVRLDAESP